MIKVISTFTVVALYTFLSQSTADANEAFFTYPGTRAMSMAGAFVAQADDSSAIWYNPGGLCQLGSPEFDVSAEYGSAPSISDTGKFSSEEQNIKFVSVGWKGDKEKETTFGMGLAYFTPYRFALYIPEKVSPTSAPIGRVDTKYSEVAWTLAGRISGFSYGANLDILWSDKSLGSSYSSSDFDTQINVGYSLGALYNLFTNEYLGVNVGGMYRSQIKMNGKDEMMSYSPEGEIIVNYLPSRPASVSGGLSFTVPTRFAKLSANAAYEKIYWADAYTSKASGMDTTKIMYGGEVIMPISIFDIALRSGLSESKPENSSKFATVKSFAYGVGVKLGKDEGQKGGDWFFDFAQEQRSFSGSNDKFNFWSASISYQR